MSDDDDFNSSSNDMSDFDEGDDEDDMDMSSNDGLSDELSDFSAEASNKKANEFVYEVLSAEEVMAKPLQMIEEVNEVLQVHPMLARQVLQYFNWNKENAVQRYFTEQEKIFKEAKLPRPEDLKSMADLPAKIDCTICFDTCKKSDVDALPCGHVFCKPCWRDYLMGQVLREGTARITCPAHNCHLSMDELSVLRLMDDQDGKKMYTKLAAKAFVRELKSLRWCPGSDCEYALKAEIMLPREVECKCGLKFCFQCGLPFHRPAPCDAMLKWEQKRSTEGESLAFFAKNTKNCPKCKALIYKDQGCQYMRCQQCSHAFCWICLTAVDHKSHNCNKFTGVSQDSERNEWNRYTHFYERWKGHADATKYEAKLMAKAEQIMKQLTEKGMNWIDAQFIKTAVESLKKARAILAVSYIMGYFLPTGTHVELFENYQGFMEEATEKLSEVLEDKKKDLIVDKRLEIINLTENLKVRIENFTAACEDDAFKAASGYKKEDKTFEIEAAYEGWIYNAS